MFKQAPWCSVWGMLALVSGFCNPLAAQQTSESRAKIIREETIVPTAEETLPPQQNSLVPTPAERTLPPDSDSSPARIQLHPPRTAPPTYFDPSVALASYRQTEDGPPLPRIFHGPPPPISIDPAFNAPSGERVEAPRTARARLPRNLPVRIPSYFERNPEESVIVNPVIPEPAERVQDPPAEEIEFVNPPPPPTGVRLRLFDESSDWPGSSPASTTQSPGARLVPPSPSPGGSSLAPTNPVRQNYSDMATSRKDAIANGAAVPSAAWLTRPGCDVDCYVTCSPLFYSTLWGGFQSMRDLSTWSSDPFDPRGTFQFDEGVAAGLGLGIYHGRNWRADFELTFRSNPLDGLYVERPAGLPAEETFLLDGHLKSYAGMSNFYWDFPKFPLQRVKPYVGVGVGFVFFDPDVHSVGRRILDPRFDGDSSFAYQWMAGLNAPLSDQFDLFCEYRFFAADSFRMHADLQSISGSGADPSSLFGDFDFRSQNILIGLRYKF